jgi:hypothetical protein
MVGLVMAALVIWMVSQAVARADAGRGSRGGNTAGMEKSHPVTVLTARPGKSPAATTPAPAPRAATAEEEALRLRSRVMA